MASSTFGISGNELLFGARMTRLIRLFMWGYQEHFRIVLQVRAREVFERLGTEVELKVLLVGALAPGSKNPNPACVEPEDNEWPLSLFAQLPETIKSIQQEHPANKLFYSNDEQSTREKPEMIWCDSVAKAVRSCLGPFDSNNNVESFCGLAARVDDYYVVPVIQVPTQVFEQFPPIANACEPPDGWPAGPPSLLHASINALLTEASAELKQPNAGRALGGRMRNSDEIVQLAARNFLYGLPFAIGSRYNGRDLFQHFNYVSSLLYEGTGGKGRIVLAHPDNSALEFALRFRDPVPLYAPRWARKILQMTDLGFVALADTELIHGLGSANSAKHGDRGAVFTIEFIDHYCWHLKQGNQVLLRSRFGVPELPAEIIPRHLFVSDCARLFPESSDEDRHRLWLLLKTTLDQRRGSMIVIAEDAATEAMRLTHQGTEIQPTLMTEQLLEQVSAIDGTILLDPHATCYAVGVILDGAANSDCTPARGSRYNSAVRYVKGCKSRRLAIVVSEDQTVDIVPRLRPQMSLALIESNIELLEGASLDNYQQPRSWLNDNRFYLNDEQCKRVNAALDRIDSLPMKMGQLRITTVRMTPDPDMNASYLLP
jgi:DisA bacterial checkpoint controller nucleotide-binding